MDKKKTISWGVVAIFLQMAIYYAIWMNPYVSAISLQFSDHPAVKPYDYFGGLENWMTIRTLYNIVILAILIKLFLLVYTKIPGVGWQKGVYFGLTISLIKVVPEAFNKWTLIVYPNELIYLQLINGTIGFTLFGILIAVIYRNKEYPK